MKTIKSENSLWKYLNNERLMLVISITAVLIANVQVLSSFFSNDDFLHFYQISNWNPLEFVFYPYGGHVFIFKHTIFYLMFKLFGMNSVAYFSIVLLTHLGIACVLYKIIYLLTEKPLIAAAATMIWGVCPVNYATLAWYCTYGQVLVGFFFLLFLYDLLRIEKGKMIFSVNIIIRWLIYLFLMATSLGNGLAIACLSPLAIVIILWKSNQKWKIAASTLPAIAIILVLYIFKESIYYYFSGEVYHITPLAPSAALNNYKIILEWFIRMVAYSIYCMAAFPMLFFSSITGYPTAVFFISIPIVILFIALFLHSKEYQRHYLVLGIFFVTLIGLTAYGRAFFYNIFGWPMSSATLLARYYYVILINVILILSLMASELDDLFPKLAKPMLSFVLIVIALSIYPSINLAKKMAIMNRSFNDHKIYFNTIMDLEKTIKASPEGSSVFIDNKMNEQIFIFLPSDTDFPGKAAIFAIGFPHNTVEGRRVYFVENDCHVADRNIAKKHWRISSLMASACDLERKETNR